MPLTTFLFAFIICLTSATTVSADTYSWTDDQGTVHFTENPAEVPKQLRGSSRRSADEATPAARETTPGDGKGSPEAEGKPAPAPSESYPFTTQEEWQTELRRQENAMEELYKRLEGIAAQFRNPQGSAAEKRELAATHGQLTAEYNGQKERYYRLVEAARKAGFPVDLQK